MRLRRGAGLHAGPHLKWVAVKGGAVARFATFMTGELFSVVSRETILSHAIAGADAALDRGAFEEAVAQAFKKSGARRQSPVPGPLTPAPVRRLAGRRAETISGTLIGLELAAGLAMDRARGSITLVASGQLAALYRLAFDTLSVAVQSIDADAAVLAGLCRAAAAIWAR